MRNPLRRREPAPVHQLMTTKARLLALEQSIAARAEPDCSECLAIRDLTAVLVEASLYGGLTPGRLEPLLINVLDSIDDHEEV